MAAPDDIENGDVPDATILMEWLNFLAAGGLSDDMAATYDAIVNSTPTNYKKMWATDAKQLLFYTKDPTQGVNGWIVYG